MQQSCPAASQCRKTWLFLRSDEILSKTIILVDALCDRSVAEGTLKITSGLLQSLDQDLGLACRMQAKNSSEQAGIYELRSLWSGTKPRLA